MLTAWSKFLRVVVCGLVLSASVAALANPPSVPQVPTPEHQRKSHIKLSGVLTLPKSDWEKRKFNQARIGDYVEYQKGNGQPMYRRTVEEVGDHTLVVKETKLADGKERTSHINYSFELPDEKCGPGNSFRESAVTVDMAGRRMPATLLEVVYQNKPLEQRWYSDEVPLGGLVKHVSGSADVKQVLSAYGRGT